MPAGQVGDPSPCALQQTCCLDSSKGRGPAHTTYGPAVEHMGLVLEKGPPHLLPELGLPCLLPASRHFGLVHKSEASHHPRALTEPCVINAPFACSLE